MPNKINDRQLEIINAAGKILTNSGVSGLTIKNLAAEIGFSESALYRHFKSKEEIIVCLLQHLGSNMNERLSATFDIADDPITKFQKLFNNQFVFSMKTGILL